MATIINNPGPGDSSADTGAGIIIGVVIAIIVIILFILYGYPGVYRNDNQTQQPGTNINVTIPNPTGGTNNNSGN